MDAGAKTPCGVSNFFRAAPISAAHVIRLLSSEAASEQSAADASAARSLAQKQGQLDAQLQSTHALTEMRGRAETSGLGMTKRSVTLSF